MWFKLAVCRVDVDREISSGHWTAGFASSQYQKARGGFGFSLSKRHHTPPWATFALNALCAHTNCKTHARIKTEEV